jgi:predicted nucleic acid-binding protein
MKKLLLDTNILLDIVLGRDPHFNSSFRLFQRIDHIKIEGFVSATTVTDIYYVARKVKGPEVALNFVSDLIQVVGVLGVDRGVIEAALVAGFKDFEDAIQAVTATVNEMDYVITRNKTDFSVSDVPALTPDEFLH